MALGGGTFLVHNKVLPGAYINFVNEARVLGNMGARGTVALPLEFPWGPEEEVQTIELADFQKDSLEILGFSYTDDELKPLRDLFRYAKTLKLYRLNADGAKASATAGEGVTIEAAYSGTRGNDLKLVIQADIDTEGAFNLITYLDTAKVDTQKISNFADFVPNGFIVIRATEGAEIEPSAGIELEGGTDGEVTGQSYADFLDKIEAEDFSVLAYAGTDEITKSLFDSFTKRMRDDEGVKIVTVMHDYKQADYEGIISVKNSPEAVYWVAGASAGAEINESLTNRVYNGEYDFPVKFKKSEFEKMIEQGEFAFYQDGEDVRVLTDINTFTDYVPTKTEDFSSNRVIRVLDQVGNDTARIFGQYYLGKVTNDKIGRLQFKNELVSYREELQGIRAIENFEADDVEVLAGEGKRDVIVNEYLQPTDAMEKLYMTTVVR